MIIGCQPSAEPEPDGVLTAGCSFRNAESASSMFAVASLLAGLALVTLALKYFVERRVAATGLAATGARP